MQRLIVYLLLTLLAPSSMLAAELGDALAPLLEGEFALQQGDRGRAAKAYLHAAATSDDPAVAARAVQVALAARDIELIRVGLERWAELEKDSVMLNAGWLRWALLKGDADAARAPMIALLERDDGWRLVAPALVTSPDRALPGQLLGELLDTDSLPDMMDAWLAFGGVALRLENKSLYSRLASAVAKRFPDEPRALVWNAEEALDKGDKETARRMLDTALALPELSPGERLSVAVQLNALGDPLAAAQALELAGDDDRILAARASYLTRGKDEQGLAALYAEAVAKTPEREAAPARLLLLGQLAEMLEEPSAAMAWYRQIAGGLQRDQAQLRVAVLLDKAGDKDAARELLREVQTGDTEWGEIIRDAYLLEADFASKQGDGEAELAALDRGLSIFEDDTVLRYSRALAYERMDRVDEALEDLRTLVEMEPEDADFLNALGYTLVDRTESFEEGLALIEAAIERKPDSPAILDSLGWALHRLGRNSDALEHLKRAFEMQREAEIGAHLAIVLAALGELDEARSILRLAKEIEPENRAVREALESMTQAAGGE